MLILRTVSDLMVSSRDIKNGFYILQKGYGTKVPEAEKEDDERNGLHEPLYSS